ncbi:MAG: choice-of-anchor H family protein [Pseudomonadota bacterium]
MTKFNFLFLAAVLSLAMGSTVAMADTDKRVSTTTQGYKSATGNKQPKVFEADSDLQKKAPRSKKTPKSINKNGQVFWIYDAYGLLNFDEDGDGFHHNFSVVFDADVEPGFAYVYADMYLSLEGGPWNHYFSTEDFSIEGSTDLDEYEVATELNSGYPRGYYDVLIELIDADTGELVAVVDSVDFAGLAALPLEDSERDSVGLTVVSHGHGGGGSLAVLLGLLVLAGASRRWI